MIEEVGLFYSLSVLDEWIELSKAMIRTVYIKGNVEALARFEDLRWHIVSKIISGRSWLCLLLVIG